jgi:hypothetical protein
MSANINEFLTTALGDAIDGVAGYSYTKVFEESPRNLPQVYYRIGEDQSADVKSENLQYITRQTAFNVVIRFNAKVASSAEVEGMQGTIRELFEAKLYGVINKNNVVGSNQVKITGIDYDIFKSNPGGSLGELIIDGYIYYTIRWGADVISY